MQPAGFITSAREVEAKLQNQHRGKGTGDGPTSPKHAQRGRSFLTGGKKRCSARRATHLSFGRPRQPAVTPIYKSMTEQTIRTSRMEQVEQVGANNRSTLKPQYCSLLFCPWNGGTMQIRYCGFEDISRDRRRNLFNRIRYGVRIVPPFHPVFTSILSGGFRAERLFDRACSTRANINGVIV